MAEGARLESVYTFTGIGGSNPSLSASSLSTIIQSVATKGGCQILIFLLIRSIGIGRNE